ncbi:MAG: tRNA uridine-5-carboxymethylaminomethyl(34) synthesis GTPase MnmE [Chthoniobacterales bacterium]
MHRHAERSAGEIVQRDTIVAISTPIGEGAIALVRMSGKTAVAIADEVFRGAEKPSQFQSHVQHFGEIISDGTLIDEVILSVHRTPGSYTGEDLVEINCHGGMLVTSRVLGACLRAGARAARPGEFTERAYLNGKIDLTQAEAVIDLIRANTDLALRAATEQLEGKLGDRFRDIRDDLISARAQVDAAIDFPEEGIEPESGEKLLARIEKIRELIENLLATTRRGRIIREGVRVVIFGPTNAGKSSLLNRLLGYERAIVSEIHGTTRDTIEELVNLGGVAVRFRDTAGIRETADRLEREGVARAQEALESADVRLLVVDASARRPEDFAIGDNVVVVLNKSDLPEHENWKATKGLRISCTTGAGFQELEQAILSQIGMAKLQPESALAVNVRHADCLRRAAAALDRATTNLRGEATDEMTALDLREAQNAIEEAIGGGDDEAVRDAIFAQFCIGK